MRACVCVPVCVRVCVDVCIIVVRVLCLGVPVKGRTVHLNVSCVVHCRTECALEFLYQSGQLFSCMGALECARVVVTK